jgi:hypothetical protein
MLKKLLTDVTTFRVREDWFEAGRSNEDNVEFCGTNFVIEAETEDGFRYNLDHNFMSGEIFDEDGFNRWYQDFAVDRAKAQELCDKIQAAVKAGRKLDEKHWFPVQGCFGSAGWDEQAEIELERRELEEERWR